MPGDKPTQRPRPRQIPANKALAVVLFSLLLAALLLIIAVAINFKGAQAIAPAESAESSAADP